MSELDLLIEAVGRLGAELRSDAGTAEANALLRMAPSSEILPCPAIALVQLGLDEPCTLDSSWTFRAVAKSGTSNETDFRILSNQELDLHSWRVERCERIHDGAFTTAIELDLSTSIGFRSDRVIVPLAVRSPLGRIGRGLPFAVISIGGERVEMRTARELVPSDLLDGTPWGLLLRTLCEQIVLVELDQSDFTGGVCTLRFDFLDPVSDRGGETEVEVFLNILPAMNSVRAEVPNWPEATVSHRTNEWVQLLEPRPRREGLKAWRISRVGSSSDGGLNFAPDASDGYRLALRRRDQEPDAPLLPAVVLSHAAHEALSRTGGRLHIDLEMTSASLANRLESGTKLRLLPSEYGITRRRIEASLFTQSLGGRDGLLGVEDPALLRSLIPAGRERTVGNTMRFLRHHFGDILVPTNSLDLVRGGANSSSRDVVLQLGCLARESFGAEVDAALKACKEALDVYLADNAVDDLRLELNR